MGFFWFGFFFVCVVFLFCFFFFLFFEVISVYIPMIHIQKEVELADCNNVLLQEALDRGGDLCGGRPLQHSSLAGCRECMFLSK